MSSQRQPQRSDWLASSTVGGAWRLYAVFQAAAATQRFSFGNTRTWTTSSIRSVWKGFKSVLRLHKLYFITHPNTENNQSTGGQLKFVPRQGKEGGNNEFAPRLRPFLFSLLFFLSSASLQQRPRADQEKRHKDREPGERPCFFLPLQRCGSHQLGCPMRSENESCSGSPHAGRRDSIPRKRGDAWALRAPGGGPLLRAAIWGGNHLQASHPQGAPVLQKPPPRDEEIHPAVQRWDVTSSYLS